MNGSLRRKTALATSYVLRSRKHGHGFAPLTGRWSSAALRAGMLDEWIGVRDRYVR
jgi:hypothetical protein